MKTKLKILTLLTFSFFLFGCPDKNVTTELKKRITELGFIPFKNPNNYYAPMSIMEPSKNDLEEEPVALPEDCFSEKLISKRTDLGIVEVDINSTDSTNLKIAVPKSILKVVDLEGGINRKRIKMVNIKFKNPFKDVITRVSAKKILENVDEICVQEYSSERNIVLNQIFGCTSVTYKFIDERGNGINFEASAIDSIKVNFDNGFKYKGNGTMELDKTLYYGYTAFNYTLTSGAGSSGKDYDLIKLKYDDILKIAERNSKN